MMRMWMVSPKEMCDRHLMGEHVETHMFIGTLRKGNSVRGYLEKGLFEPKMLVARHNELAAEMRARGFNHKSNILPSDTKGLGLDGYDEQVDVDANREELRRRCVACRELQGVST